MCLSTPEIPQREEPRRDEDTLLLTPKDEEERLAASRKRGTQGLQIALNTGSNQGGGLAI